MAHYIFQRNNGYNDLDFIRNFETMAITDFPQFAAQIEDKDLAHLDIGYLNGLGFYAVGIKAFNLRIDPRLKYQPYARGAYKSAVLPRNPRAHTSPKTKARPRKKASSRAPHPIRPEEVLGAILKTLILPKNAPKPPKPVRVPKPKGWGRR